MQDFGGVDSYTNAISDIYQDNFDKGIFTGKGIYDLKVFNEVLENEIPENTVLSHDLLEGCYLRCGLATDILVLDGYPYKYNAYISRYSRWLRGDWQIYRWLKNSINIKNRNRKKNPLSNICKFKILDNLRRSLLPITDILLLIIGIFISCVMKMKLWQLGLIGLVSYVFSSILEIVNSIIFKKNISSNYVLAHKNILPTIGNLKGSLLRGIINISFLPYLAYVSAKSIIKTLYRLKITKKHLLEWQTSEEAEKNSRTDLYSYIKNMFIGIIFGIILLLIGINFMSVPYIILSLLWIASPFIAYNISKEIKSKEEKILKQDKEYLIDIGNKTWGYFKDNINERNNFLPPDNYQEDRKEKIAR